MIQTVHNPLATLLSLRRYSTIDNMFLAVNRIDHLHALPHLSDSVECADQRFRILAREAERLEKLRLVAVVWMRGVQAVLEHLVSFDDGELRVSTLHDRVLCRGAHRRSRGTTAVDLSESGRLGGAAPLTSLESQRWN